MRTMKLSQQSSYATAGYLKKFNTLEEVKKYLGADPVLSRFGCIVRIKDGRTKKRIILDLKQSKVTSGTRKRWRVMLPRLVDLIADIVDMSCDLADDEDIAVMVLDFVDAFWNIPLAFGERRFFVGKVRGILYVYTRSAQGSRNAPLSWAAVIALVE